MFSSYNLIRMVALIAATWHWTGRSAPAKDVVETAKVFASYISGGVM